jgi:hemerythrin-like domain-containing protein
MQPSPLTLHASPAAGFEEPFEMLRACHERVQRMCSLLLRLQAHLAQSGPDDQARQAATDVMRYFDTAGPAHHEDEERHVLPRLRQAGQAALAERLAQDHRVMAEQWAAVRADLASVAGGAWPAATAAAAARSWPDFLHLYEQHIQAEEGQAYPAVEAVLDAAHRGAMGDEMAQRRGLPSPGR